jgi:hypothetical protein
MGVISKSSRRIVVVRPLAASLRIVLPVKFVPAERIFWD